MTGTSETPKTAAPWTRVLVLFVALAAALWISYFYTGSALPENPKDSLVFQNALLLVILGSAVLELHYTKPADAVVNSLMGMVSLVTVYGIAYRPTWWLMFGYCALVFLLATTCVSASTRHPVSKRQQRIAAATYGPAVLLGRARTLFSVLFLFALFSFYQLQSPHTVALVLFWGTFILLWPLGVPQLLTRIFAGSIADRPAPIGSLVRTDTPNILRFAIEPTIVWAPTQVLVYKSADEKTHWALPLYSNQQQNQFVGTALSIGPCDVALPDAAVGCVFAPPAAVSIPQHEIMALLGETNESRLAGYIVEGSRIGSIRFEVLDSESLYAGALVWCRFGGKKVYFQVTDGETRDEELETDRHGVQVGIAAQLGVLSSDVGFEKVDWLPQMNALVFAASAANVPDPRTIPEHEFTYGYVPNSNLRVTGPFAANFNYHTAIFGVTGTGKTELAFDMIRDAIANGIKVLCIDLTSQYQSRLTDLHPVDLSISHELSKELSKRLFEVETGEYGAKDEKKALHSFASELRKEIVHRLTEFIEATDDHHAIGLIQLEEISNTRASIYITQLYLSALLDHARTNIADGQRILVVVEEAHTVMPEPGTMGLADNESRGLVGKIAQVALQGRKYGVGLLIVAQRTATVSKTVLTQCNTMICFALYDDTSLSFLRNFFGETQVAAIPNLKPLHALVFGKAIRSQRPIVMAAPFSPDKQALGL